MQTASASSAARTRFQEAALACEVMLRYAETGRGDSDGEEAGGMGRGGNGGSKGGAKAADEDEDEDDEVLVCDLCLVLVTPLRSHLISPNLQSREPDLVSDTEEEDEQEEDEDGAFYDASEAGPPVRSRLH